MIMMDIIIRHQVEAITRYYLRRADVDQRTIQSGIGRVERNESVHNVNRRSARIT